MDCGAGFNSFPPPLFPLHFVLAIAARYAIM